MQQVGAELKQAREHAGLSAEQIAERTKIKLHKIVALEDGDFEGLPQGIYLDGIVRAYAHEVALDPEAMVERVRIERGTLPGDWPVPFETHIDLHGTPVQQESLVLDDIPVLDVSGGNDPLDSFAQEPDLAAVPMARPPRQRAGVLAPVLLLIAAAGLGVYFYDRAPNAVRRDTPRIFDTPTPSARSDSTGPTANAAPSSVQIGTTGSIPNVSGAWAVATRVESSSLSRFKGLQLGYQMNLEQQGDRVTGVGRKIAENGGAIGSRARTPVSVAGTIDGDRLTLNFTERGTRRPTRGTFVLLLDETGTLRGRFTSTAARSSGTVEAQRMR
jgi:hypothetical protein